MFKGEATSSRCELMFSDPVHVAYIEAGNYRAGVKANGLAALSIKLSVIGDCAETSMNKSVKFL